MDIITLAYFIFVAITAIVYWTLDRKNKWIVILFSSLIFFFINSKPVTIVYMLYSAVSVYIGSIILNRINDKARKIVAIFVVLSNIAILGVLKYSNLFVDAVNFLGIAFHQNVPFFNRVDFVAPLAISFYTLQIIGYFIDCYRGDIETEHNFLKLMLFTCYFPMMVSGPICRYDDMKETLFRNNHFDYKRVSNGIKEIAFGLIKKLAVGNRLFSIVSIIDSDISKYHGYYIWISALLYSVYLYMDFSGCMDIISGVSNILGINLPRNFRAPFFSKSTKEFWRRWHITLGAWLRDYVLDSVLKSRLYINFTKFLIKQFGRKRGRNISVYISMLSVWICMGIWHGNGWKYVLGEGFWYWLVIVLGMMFNSQLEKACQILKIDVNSCYWHFFQSLRTVIIFSIGNIFFKASSLKMAFYQIKMSFSIKWAGISFNNLIHNNPDVSGIVNAVVLLAAISLVLIADIGIYRDKCLFDMISKENVAVRWSIYTLMIVIIVLSLGTHSEQFAYAKF